MREIANIETVRGMCDALGRGQSAGVLDRLDETIVWIVPGSTAVPMAGRRHGIEEVRGFLDERARSLTLTTFETREFLAQGNRVIALVHYEGTVNATGRTFSVESAMLWTLGNGRALRFREYTDTQALAEAARFCAG
jgi:ketosteroid isomerase-like protein